MSKNRLEIPSGNMKRTLLKQKKVQIIISRRATRTLRQSKQQLPFKGPFRNKTEEILETKRDILETKQGTDFVVQHEKVRAFDQSMSQRKNFISEKSLL